MVAVSTVHSRARGMGATAIPSSLSDCPAVLLPCLAEPLSIGDARDAEWIHLAATYASVVLTGSLTLLALPREPEWMFIISLRLLILHLHVRFFEEQYLAHLSRTNSGDIVNLSERR